MEISVVICVANDVRIRNMLNSIKTKCEVLVVLNGCTDEVRSIVNEYKNSEYFSLKIVEIPERNLSKSRNVGILKAKYKKVVFYDSDCIMVENALSYFNEYLNDFLLVDGYVKFKGDKINNKIVAILRSFGLPGFALCPSMGVHKDIIKKIGYYFDEDIKWIEDSELNHRAKKNNIEIGVIKQMTCIHDNLTFRQDLRSAFRYGSGVKTASRKGLHKKMPTANWNLIIPCCKKNILAGFYCIVWNIVYCCGYYLT